MIFAKRRNAPGQYGSRFASGRVSCGTCSLAIIGNRSFQFANDLNMIRGRHQISLGVDYKYTDGTSGYLSPSALPLYFGLGDAAKIDSVEVDWPSGRKQVEMQRLEINRTLQMVEPK